MRTVSKLSRFCRQLVVATALCASLSLMLAGCGAGTLASAGNGLGPQAVGGKAMGGNGPIGNAAVKLYLAGTTGYGSAGTLLRSTTTSTDGNGYFSFDPSSYTCPTGGQVYVVLNGGDPNGGSAASNDSIGLAAALGSCGSLPSFTVVNEVTTVATTFAAAQFFSATAETFGSPASTQAQQGLANAFALAEAIVPAAVGQAVATYTPSSSVSGVTMTATPESSKIHGIADILSSCVNTPMKTSPACTDLFNSAVGPPEASATSGSTQISGNFNAATDTLIAAYYMAINPIDATAVGGTTGTNPSCAAAANASVSNITCLFDMITGTPPFATTLSLGNPPTTPNLLDWTISVAYSASGTCGSLHGMPLTRVQKAAVDANGNLWMITDSIAGPGAPTTSTYSVMGEMSPTGNLLNCQGGTTDTVAAGRAITIDTAGNIWAGGQNGTLVNAGGTSANYGNRILEYNLNLATPTLISETAPATIKLNAMAADGLGNIYIPGNASTGNVLYEFAGGANATTSTAVAPTVAVAAPVIVGDSGTQSLLYIAADSSGNIWLPNNTDTNVAVVTPAQVDTTFSVDKVSTQYGAAIDANGALALANTCCVSSNANKIYKVIPGAAGTPGNGTTDGAISAQYAGGLSATRALTIDGANNVWSVGANPTNSTGQYNIVELDASLSALSTTGTLTGTSCPNTSCLTNGGFAKASLASASDIEVDGSGNVWAFGNIATQVTQLIGAAVPVVTPLSIATEYSRLGKMPTNLNAMNFLLPAETETAGAVYNATVKFGTNSPAPTGTITLTPVGSGTPTCTLSSTTTAFTGTVICSAANSTLPVGTYKVTFTYSGDSNYYAVPSGIVTTLTVQ